MTRKDKAILKPNAYMDDCEVWQTLKKALDKMTAMDIEGIAYHVLSKGII